MNARGRVPFPVRLLLIVIVAWLAAAEAVAQPQAGGLAARHQLGQTLLVWKEVDPPVTQDTITAVELSRIRRDLDQQKQVRYRVYRSRRPISSVEDLRPIAEVPPLSGWNADYHGISPDPQQPALRYVVREGRLPMRRLWHSWAVCSFVRAAPFACRYSPRPSDTFFACPPVGGHAGLSG